MDQSIVGHKREHMPCLDGLRGLAALLVLLGHAPDFGWPSFVDGNARNCGVLIFFALSGFLMGDLYLTAPASGETIKAYIVARIARIVPIYYLIVIAAFIIHSVDPAFVYAVTQQQLVRLLTFNGSVSVFWSIGPEVQFYAVFVVLWLARSRLRHDGIFACAVLVLVASGFMTIDRWSGIFVASKVHIFGLGTLAALLRLHVSGRMSATAIKAAHAAAFCALAVLILPGMADTSLGPVKMGDAKLVGFFGSVPRVAIAAFLSFAFSFSSPLATATLANKAMTALGRWSFSIYLLHEVVFDAVTRSGFTASLPAPLAIMSVTALSVGAAAGSFSMLERPLQRIVRTVLTARPQRLATDEPGASPSAANPAR